MAIQHGMNQQTPAVQNTLKALRPQRVTAKRMKSPTTKRYKKSLKASPKRRKRKGKSTGSTKSRLKKGSAQAKAYMAKIRKLRK